MTWKDAGTRYPGPVPPEDGVLPLAFPDNVVVREQMGRFQASVQFMDHDFGVLMAALDRPGLRESTLVMFTTDHGISGPDSKGTLSDLGTEIALIARNPDGFGTGSSSDALIPNIDFRPTLCEAARVPIPPEVEGRSFLPVLRGAPYAPNAYVFSERNFHGESAGRHAEVCVDAFDPVRAVRTARYHYIRWLRPAFGNRPPAAWEVPPHYVPEGPPLHHGWPETGEPRPGEALFDCLHAPQEWVNLAGRPEYRTIREDLSARLNRWMEDTGDFLLRDNVPSPPKPEGLGEGWPLE